MRATGIRANVRTMRMTFAWLIVCALFMAPVIVNLTHSPADIMTAEGTALHGHSHADIGGNLFPGHDATDHEHQFQGLLPHAGDKTASDGGHIAPGRAALLSGAIREGPRRPPRIV
jgi:hypothetical protein